MRKKMSTKETHRKKEKRNQIIIGVTLTLLMVFSVFGIIVNSFSAEENSQEELSYKGLELINQGSYYQLNVGEASFYLSENPNNLSQVDYQANTSKIITDYSGLPLYIDSKDYQALREVYQNFQGYPLRIQEACLNEGDCPNEELPIKTCSDNMIIIRESSENRIYENESCVFIEGQEEDLLKMTDIFILKVLGLN